MIKQIELKYGKNDLNKVISENTMNFHYGKHHVAYVNNYNDLVKGTKHENQSIEEVLSNLDAIDDNIKQGVINNGGGAFNHNLYFEQFSSEEVALSDEKFIAKINDTFGSKEEMISKLVDCGMKQFGSGWSWLVLDGEELKIISTANQDSPISNNQTPLLTLDVWEHAYYLDYQNVRKQHLEDLFKIMNWAVVEDRFNK